MNKSDEITIFSRQKSHKQYIISKAKCIKLSPVINMLQEPNIEQIQIRSQAKSQNSQNKMRHRNWLMLQCEFWFFHLFVAALSLYLISEFAKVDLEATSYYSTDQYKYGMQAINIWGKGYIIDIKQVSSDNCPYGYTQLINYYWPGTYDGCYCQTVVNNHASEYILKGSCSSQLISYGCTTISKLSAQELKMWKGTKLLCYKRVQSLSFYNSTLKQTQSGTVMASCATDKSYQVNNLPQIPCPVSVLSNSSVGSSTQTNLSLDSSNNFYLYYQMQQNYPIADFKISQYSFCPFFDQINISPDKSGNYLLEVVNQSTTCTQIDPRMVEFDYMTEQDYYTNNTRVYNLISSLPGFPRPSINYNYRLGYVRYPAWTYSCRQSESHNLLSAAKHLKFTHITEKTKLILYVGVPCLLIVALLVRILYMIRHIFELKSKKQYNMLILTDQEIGQQIPNLNIVKSFKRQLFYLIMQLMLMLATLVVLAICVYFLINESIWIKSAFNDKCTEDHLNWIFRYNQDKVDICAFIVARSIMFVLVLMTAQVGNFVIRSRHGDLKANEIKVEESLSNQNLIKDDLDEKQKNLNYNMQDSSDVLLQKEKQQVKIYDLDNFMSNQLQPNNAGETGFNFYAIQSIEQENLTLGKKKKKKGVRRKNLFKQLSPQPQGQ